MIPELLVISKPTIKPRRPGRPRAAEAAIVRECAEAVGRKGISAVSIAKRLGVHRATVYRWLQLAESA